MDEEKQYADKLLEKIYKNLINRFDECRFTDTGECYRHMAEDLLRGLGAASCLIEDIRAYLESSVPVPDPGTFRESGGL